jgi:ribose 5-phosphate isomerase A
MNYDPASLRPIAQRAMEFIRPGTVIGLGSGRAARAFITHLGQRVKEGFRITGVPTSQETADLARSLGIPLTALDAVNELDVTIDGADEVDTRNLNLIKGLGGALVREKIVAASSKRLVILVTPEKLAAKLGSHGVLPVEIVPFGMTLCRRRLEQLGYPPNPREVNGKLFVTDNGNHILDCQVPPLDDPEAVERTLLAIPGVVGTGLFVNMANVVLVQDGDNVKQYDKPLAA